MAKYKVGVAGMTHDHIWKELGFWRKHPDVELVACADPNGELRQRAKQDFDIAKRYDSVAEMLEAEKLDIVQVCGSNRDGVEATVAAAGRGIHLVVEKPMAHTLAGADRMLAAVREAGVKLAINWPNYFQPNLQQAFKMLGDQVVGPCFHARFRMAHEGPREIGCSTYFCDWLYDAEQNGGGALIDYCCYGAAACRQLFGRPKSVVGVSARLVKTDIPVEDQASITMVYDHQFCVSEASWCDRPWYHAATFRCTKGTLWTDDRGRLFIDKSQHGDPEEVPCPALPAGRSNCPEYLITCLETGEEPVGMTSPEVARDAQEILDAGQRSAATGQRIDLPA